MIDSVRKGQLFHRYEGNPILSSDGWPYTVNAVFNPGATTGPDGETILLVRVEDRSGRSHLTVARSQDGLTEWSIDKAPAIEPTAGRYEDRWGAEDPRITRLGDEYLIAYTGFSTGGPLVCLVSTRDFRTFDHRATVSPPEDKNAALFPQLFSGRYGLIHRPLSSGSFGQAPDIWISFSPDLRYWGEHRILIESRRTGHWDRERVGLGPPPLLTDSGWLILYHGVRMTAAGALYRVGLALLDQADPTLVLARSNEWVFGPEAPYERTGDVPGVVFPTGWIRDEGSVRMYYGAADSTVAVATASLVDLEAFVFTHCVCGKQHPGKACEVGGKDPGATPQHPQA
jgi:predicted GH43/DUF377 family glycosyl hydrolase